MDKETIAAIATPSGRGAVGIVRISGSKTKQIALAVLGYLPTPRYAHYTDFLNEKKEILDKGLAVFFEGPLSFTGEDVLELQGHGGPVVLDLLLKEVVSLGVRLAQPGEFTLRAFLNDKIDLTQAEAIADLINSASEQAARSAVHSLQGTFSKKINALNQKIITLRLYIEAAIDFATEEIDFLADGKVLEKLQDIQKEIESVYQQTQQGVLLQEGMRVVIAGRPNAGKSSLLNALAEKESAIVTPVAGTTRDILKETIHIDGMPIHIIDTAGLRESNDIVEQEGIRRAKQEIKNADRLLLLVDSTTNQETEISVLFPDLMDLAFEQDRMTIIRNKADLSKEIIGEGINSAGVTIITTSAKTGEGIPVLREHLKKCMGFQNIGEGCFIARRRHIEAINLAKEHIEQGYQQLATCGAGELLAEELKLASAALGEIAGSFSSDDLLGKIFSSFCIGK